MPGRRFCRRETDNLAGRRSNPWQYYCDICRIGFTETPEFAQQFSQGKTRSGAVPNRPPLTDGMIMKDGNFKLENENEQPDIQLRVVLIVRDIIERRTTERISGRLSRIPAMKQFPSCKEVGNRQGGCKSGVTRYRAKLSQPNQQHREMALAEDEILALEGQINPDC
nr:hypothetical protein Iba_chr01cCG7050 [Ipomoea batatas]